MRIQCSSKRWRKMMGCLCLALVALMLAAPAHAATAGLVKAKEAKVFSKPSVNSKVIGVVKKNDKLTITAMEGRWAKVKVGGNVGYVPKSAVAKTKDSTVKPAKQNTKDKRTTVKQIQQRLADKGYLKSGSVTGSGNDATSKSLRIFQMMNGLSINGKTTRATVKKLMSSKARKRVSVSGVAWSKSGINHTFHTRGSALIIDMATGARIYIRRVGGHNHLDVEPRTARDTKVLKRVYGGAWSWDSRGILLIAGGRCYAAAMNGMPHGAEISKDNQYDGQFCVHLRGSLTHGTERENEQHQDNIDKVYQYFQ